MGKVTIEETNTVKQSEIYVKNNPISLILWSMYREVLKDEENVQIESVQIDWSQAPIKTMKVTMKDGSEYTFVTDEPVQAVCKTSEEVT